MSRLSLLLLFFLSTQVFALDDFLSFIPGGTGLSRTQFNRIIILLQKTFAPYAQRNGRELEFQTDFDAEWAQSFARRWETDQVVVFGGVARIKGMTEDALVLALCHELGHLYGGKPWGEDYNQLAVEGQADYWSASTCWKVVQGENQKERGLAAAQVLVNFYADNRNLPHPQIQTPSTLQVDHVLYDHPTPQCRLDTLVAGFSAGDRPRCWYAPSL